RQLEAAPGERPALDVGARCVRLEAPTLDAAGEPAARAGLIERAGLDVDQVRWPGVERVAEGRIARDARLKLGLVVGGQQERQPGPAHAAYTDCAAASAEPGDTRRPSARSASSSAARTASTCARRLDSPMRPMRHTLPFIGPSPPPISMPCSVRSRVRTRASSTPSGTVTAFSI